MKVTGSLIKLTIFAVVTILLTGVLAATIGSINFGKETTYRALFSDATGVLPGDDVRIAGVRVGSVKGVEIADRRLALVSFSVDSDRPVARSTGAAIRYRNLVGQRFIALNENAGDSSALPAGGLIPLSQTKPALDLTALFNGFKPLFRALEPKQVNQLAFEIIQTLQGEGGTINALLGHVGSLTSALADRDAVIGRLIDQLNVVLATVDERDQRLSQLIVSLQQFATGYAGDAAAIGQSLVNINAVTAATAGLLTDVRPPLKDDIASLGRTSQNLNDGEQIYEGVLQRLPNKLNRIINTAIYGSFFNFYLCEVDGQVALPSGAVMTPKFVNDAARCK